MAVVKLSICIRLSLIALAATYFAGAVATGLRFFDTKLSLLCLIWSTPFFVAAWIFAGIPAVAAGDLVLRVPKSLTVFAGAAAGVLVLFLLVLMEWLTLEAWKTLGVTRSIALPWLYLTGWPAFCAALGAGAIALYRWLLARASR